MKRSVLLLIAGILGLCYVFYLIAYFGGAVSSTEGTSQLGAGIATAIVMPHMICVIIAVIFNVIGWICNLRWAALVAAIMYAVSMVLFFMYALFVIVQMILCFIAFALMKKNKE